MPKQKNFTKEFEAEAVRLALTSGRTQREIAQDLGVGLSTISNVSRGPRPRHALLQNSSSATVKK